MRKLFWLSVFAGCSCLLALVAGPAHARTLAEIRSSGALKVGFTGDYAPYDVRDSAGQYSGSDVTAAQTLARDLGVALTIVPTTWNALESDFSAGRFDIAMGGVSITPGRAAIGVFSRPVIADGKRPIVRCSDRERFTSIDAINRPDVAIDVDRGGTNEAFTRAHFPKAALQTFTNNEAMFDDVAAGYADVIVTDGAEVNFQAAKHPGVLCPADVAEPFNHFQKAYLMSPDASLKQAVDAVIARGADTADPAPDSAAAGPAPWKDTPVVRLEALALLESLNAELLGHDSATLVLEHWCDSHHLATPPEIVAERDPAINKAPTPEQLQRLQVKDAKQVRYRAVKLRCGSRVLSEADNWYVPERLTAAMNKALDTTNISFGRAVAALRFQRHTLSVDLLWHPLPEGWENAAQIASADTGPVRTGTPQSGVLLQIPDHILQHHAILTRSDGLPFSEVAETYTGAVLDFMPPDAR